MFAYDRLHWGYHGKGMYGEGVKAAERAVELSGPDDARRLGFLGHTYGLVGSNVASKDTIAILCF
jgi:hypothetical protein